mmetsp:Transcript_110241/g.212448  ORF Transcript_110241/g.212448 Transcript_110241/m.212448 type:complete len:657 (+) Transcript_110241:86-2056(+)
MHLLSFAAACFACAAVGYRLRTAGDGVQDISEDSHRNAQEAHAAVPTPLTAMVTLLQAVSPAAGWQASGARLQVPQAAKRAATTTLSAGSQPRADASASLGEGSQRRARPHMSTVTSAAPSTDVWNDQIKEAWTRAYESANEQPIEYEITSIDGAIPEALRGTIFRNGPGNFERGGKRYEHVLDGDGLLLKFSLDGSTGRARFASRFVDTPEYVEERAANTIKHRNTFGTQPPGFLANFGNVQLKNPANTNVQFSWGGKCLALWEAALPCRIDPATLSYVGVESFDGMLPDGALTATVGLSPEIEQSFGLGVAMTAHPHEDRKRGRMVSWTWAAPLVGETLQITIYEWDTSTGELLHSMPETLPSPVAPHDFAITDNYYVFALNAMELKLAPFLLGLTGPVGALSTTGQGVTLKLIPRPGSSRAGSPPLTIQTDDPYFAIHHAAAFEEEPLTPGGAPVLRLYTAAWPRVGQGPFLGDWGGAVPLYDDGKINPTQLLETTIELSDKTTSVKLVPVAEEACIDHPHIDPRFEGDSRVRYVYMSYCNPEGVSGSPPLGWARWDRQTGELAVWRAPPRTFCEEIVVIPRPRTEARTSDEETDEADVWIAGMMFDADSGRSSLAILDGDNIEAGPVCRLWLNHHVPHGLHGTYTPELFGAF